MNTRRLRGLNNLILYLNLDDIIMAEIGCYKGTSTFFFCKYEKIKKIYAIDSWENGYDPKDKLSYSNMKIVEEIFDEKMKTTSKCIKIKEKSHIASEKFENESLDFVYIDACHLYENVKLDINSWLPKIKKNGYIGGHDYKNRAPGVKKAVNEILGIPNVTFSDSSWIIKI